MRGDFLETVDAGNPEHTGLLVDFELVALAALDFFAVRKAGSRTWSFLSIEWW